MTIVAVTGATGNVGRPLALELRRRGIAVRALGRSAERLRPLTEAGADPLVGDLADPRFLALAFRGADAVFAMIPPEYDHPDPTSRARGIVEAIAAGTQVARVRHAVSLSSVGADRPAGNGPIAWLHYLERRLDQVPGLHTTHLRPGYFFENHLGSIGVIKAFGKLAGGFQPGVALPMTATADIAAAAALRLADLGWTGQQVQELQGPRDYTFPQVASILGAAIGRPTLGYEALDLEAVAAALQGAGFSPGMAGLFAEMIDGFNTGRLAMRTPRSPATSNPTSLEQFAATVFAPAFGA